MNEFDEDVASGNCLTIRSEIVDGFLCAASNHYIFDQISYKIFEEKIEDFCGIPRPAKWMKKSRRIRRIFKFGGWWGGFLWRHCLAYLFYIKCFFVYLRRKKSFDSCFWDSSSKDLSLAVCSRSVAVISQALVGEKDKTWLTFPWEDVVSQIGVDEKVVDCVSVLSRMQLVHALFSAFSVHKRLKKCENNNMLMQGYAAFDWAVVYMALKNMAPNALITSEHHDRWAVLVDTYCMNMLKSGGKVGFKLVQHGLEYEQVYVDMEKDTICGGLPYKLKCVTDIYLYSKEQCAIFSKNILSEDSLVKSPNVMYFTPKISMYDAEGGDEGVRVLFVGHTACEELQVKIYNYLSRIFDFKFFYKPHPTAKMHKDLLGLGWQVVEGDLNFPKVDFLISYQSTLVDEYKAVGIDAFVHPMVLSDGDFDVAMSGLVARLKDMSGVGCSG